MSIQVINLKNEGDIATPNVIYVGAKYMTYQRSPLASQFKPVGDTKEAQELAVQKYAQWLNNIIKAPLAPNNAEVVSTLLDLVARVKRGEEVNLGCWHHPQPCHAHMIKRCVLWLIRQGVEE